MTFESWPSRQSTGSSSTTEKLLFSKVFAQTPYDVQNDFPYITGFSEKPIFHMVDVSLAFLMSFLDPDRQVQNACCSFETILMNAHCPPQKAWAAPKFYNKSFCQLGAHCCTQLKSRLTQRHNTSGTVNQKQTKFCLLYLWLNRQVKFFTKNNEPSEFGTVSKTSTSKTFPGNVLYGHKILRNLKRGKNCTPMLLELPNTNVILRSDSILNKASCLKRPS